MKSELFVPVETASVQFDQQGRPFSTRFEDVYFSKESGLEESRHVFLQGNELSERFKKNKDVFVIAEVGFGSGLNFIATLELWQKNKVKSSTLHYYAFEKHPLIKEDLVKISKLFPQLVELYQPLLKAYPVLTPRWHHLLFGSVELHLWIGEAQEGLSSLLLSENDYFNHHFGTFKVDAFYLDGFRPKANPSLWDKILLKSMAEVSKKSTTFATYSCARVVRDGLISAGFTIEKRKGFAYKREMLVGRFNGKNEIKKPVKEYNSKLSMPWYISKNMHRSIQKVAVIGSGLSGAHVSHFLANAGVEVCVFEKENKLSANASGNQQGLLNLSLSPFLNAWSAYQLSSFLFAARFYKSLGIESLTGMVKLLQKENELAQLEKLKPILKAYPDLVKLVEGSDLKTLLVINPPCEKALFFPNSGSLEPPKISKFLLNRENIKVRTGAEVSELNNKNKEWLIEGEHFDAVVIANGHLANRFEQTNFLPVKGIAGEVTYLPESSITKKLAYPLCAEGYLSKALNGVHSLGATYEVGERLKKSKNVENLLRLPTLVGSGGHFEASELDSRVSVRATTPDYMPLVGEVPVKDSFIREYTELSKDANLFLASPGEYHQNLYVLSGLGSNGLTYAPLSAYVLSSIMLQKPQMVSTSVLKSLSPARFLIRDLKRGVYKESI